MGVHCTWSTSVGGYVHAPKQQRAAARKGSVTRRAPVQGSRAPGLQGACLCLLPTITACVRLSSGRVSSASAAHAMQPWAQAIATLAAA